MVTGALHLVAYVVLAWAVVVAIVSLEALRRLAMQSLRRRAPSAPGAARLRTEVLLVRPCAGAEPLLTRALSSLKDARASLPVRCRFAIADETDAALPAAERACEELRAAGIDAQIILTAADGPNRKASQLAAIVSRESGTLPADGVLIVADSDVDLAHVDLDPLISPLLGPHHRDAVWVPPFESDPQTRADRASAAVLGGSLHAFPLLALLDDRGAVGKLFSVRLDALAATGGFGSLKTILGEDVELARRLRARGGSVAAASFAAPSLARGRSWDQVTSRYARWIVMVRAQRPWLLLSYPGLFFAAPLLLSLCALIAPVAPSIALASAALTITARLLVAAGASRAAGRPVRLASLFADTVLADAVLAVAFARALRTRTIRWRSTELTVDPSGALRETAV